VTPAVSVVIAARNAGRTIDQQLGALAEQADVDRCEVVVADNGSSDGTAEVARRWAGRGLRLRVVDAARRTGVNAARNAGVAAAVGEHVVLADADDAVEPGWLSAMAGALGADDVVGGMLRDWDGGVEASPPRSAVQDDLGFLPYAVGACLGLRRSAWEAVGGFDESIVSGGDEIDLCWRVLLSGGTLGSADGATRYRSRPATDELATRRRYCASHARLYRRYRDVGMPRSDLAEAGRTWAGLGRSLLGDRRWASDPHDERARSLALRSGRLVGSLRHRVVYL
jgi:glycosyltransferase involved in cell wall biosynthesis